MSIEFNRRNFSSQTTVKCALRNFAISFVLVSSLCLYVMDESLSSIFSKIGEARLYKLFQFVRFGASTIDEDMREERIFVRRDVK